jgi:hypothetical protein
VIDESAVMYKNAGSMYEMQVYFSELKYTYTESTPAYSWFALLSDVGGALGLILGSTVLTFFELGDLIMTLILTTIDRKMKEKAAKARKVKAAASAAAAATTTTTASPHQATVLHDVL